MGLLEPVANTINLMLNAGSEAYGPTDGEPLSTAKQAGNPAQFLFTGQSSFPMDPGGIPWDSSNVSTAATSASSYYITSSCRAASGWARSESTRRPRTRLRGR